VLAAQPWRQGAAPAGPCQARPACGILAAGYRRDRGRESPPRAALREVREETGFQLAEADLTEIAVGLQVVITPELTISKTLYTARVPHRDVVIHPGEHQAFQWLAPAEVSGALLWDSNRRTWEQVSRHHQLAPYDGQ